MDITKKIDSKKYGEYVTKKMPKSNLPLDIIKAFVVGGLICETVSGLSMSITHSESFTDASLRRCASSAVTQPVKQNELLLLVVCRRMLYKS